MHTQVPATGLTRLLATKQANCAGVDTLPCRQDSRENPLRNPFINVLAVLVIAVRLVWGLEGDQRTVNHLLLGHSPRFPQEFPPCPHWQAWAHEMVLNQLMPYMAPEQVQGVLRATGADSP